MSTWKSSSTNKTKIAVEWNIGKRQHLNKIVKWWLKITNVMWIAAKLKIPRRKRSFVLVSRKCFSQHKIFENSQKVPTVLTASVPCLCPKYHQLLTYECHMPPIILGFEKIYAVEELCGGLLQSVWNSKRNLVAIIFWNERWVT